MEYEYKKRNKKADKKVRNKQFNGSMSSRHIRITTERMMNDKENKIKVATQP